MYFNIEKKKTINCYYAVCYFLDKIYPTYTYLCKFYFELYHLKQYLFCIK